MMSKYSCLNEDVSINSLTPSTVLRHTPQRCTGGSSLQHCNALQYIALYYNVAQAVIHAIKRRPAALRGVSVATLKHVPRS